MNRKETVRQRRPLSTAKKIERALKRIPALVIIGVLLCVGFIVAKKIVRPVMLYARDKQEITKMEQELKQTLAENKRLRKQTKYLRTPEGAQTEARKLGYVHPGEVSFMLEKRESKQ